MRNKKGLGKLTMILVALTIFSGSLIGLSTFISEMGSPYGVTQNTSLETFSRMENMSSLAEDSQSFLETGIGPIDTINAFLSGAYSVFINFFGVPELVESILGDINAEANLHIPTWAITMFVTVFVIVIVLIMVASALQKNNV